MAGLIEGVVAKRVDTPRLETHLLESNPESGEVVLFVHGDLSSSRFFEETLAALPPRYRGIAPDLRGYGNSEAKPVDAARGLRDFSDDLHSMLESMGLGDRRIHLVGWSMGGNIAMQYAVDNPALTATLVLISPLSPYGLGGTRDEAGTPCWPDYAGSGAGAVNPQLVRRIAAGDRGEEDPNSPRNVMNNLYFKPPFRADSEREEVYLSAMLDTKTGEENYPGDRIESGNWPKMAPGQKGVNNAISPKYCDLSGFISIGAGPDVLWVRGSDDKIVSNASAMDFGVLGEAGTIPDWPGKTAYPPQPMVSQTRAVLERYTACGGAYREAVIEDCGHSPHIEKPEEFRQLLFDFLTAHT